MEICKHCGALVADMIIHLTWHEQVAGSFIEVYNELEKLKGHSHPAPYDPFSPIT